MRGYAQIKLVRWNQAKLFLYILTSYFSNVSLLAIKRIKIVRLLKFELNPKLKEFTRCLKGFCKTFSVCSLFAAYIADLDCFIFSKSSSSAVLFCRESPVNDVEVPNLWMPSCPCDPCPSLKPRINVQ